MRPSESIFCGKLYFVRQWNKEKNVYMNLKMGKGSNNEKRSVAVKY